MYRAIRRANVAAGILVVVAAVGLMAQSTATGATTVYVTKTGAKYHKAGCSSLAKSAIPMKLEEAVKKYGPCLNCKPPVLASSSTAKPTANARAKASDGQCEATTKKGTRCSRKAQPGSRYCWQHQK